MTLLEEKCAPVRAGDKPLPELELQCLAYGIPRWARSEKQLEREFKFKDFHEAMAFVNRVAGIANAQDHHPDMLISYNRVKVMLSTHKIGGLSRNDFIVAAQTDRLVETPAGA